MKRIAYIVGAGLTKALQDSFRVPLMRDFVSVLADHLDDNVILTHLAEMEAEALFENSTPDTRAFAQTLVNDKGRTPAARAKFKAMLQGRPSENIETLLQRSLDRKGNDAAPTRFNFAINRFFYRISGGLNVEPLRRFLRYQFRLRETRHVFISFNYDLTLDRCVQQEGKERWNVEEGYGFPIRHAIRPDEGTQHMQQFGGVGGAFGILRTTPLKHPIHERTITILKPHGSLNFVFPFEDNYNFKDGPTIMILSDTGAITYYEGFDLQHVALADAAMPEANRGLYLVPPTSAKKSGLATINTIRHKVAQALQEADEIYVIGWSMPKTDEDQMQFINDAMKSRTTPLQRLTVVTYSPAVDYIDRIAATFQVPRASITVFNEGFVPFVNATANKRFAALPWLLVAAIGILVWTLWRSR
jgi:hypothetical protein